MFEAHEVLLCIAQNATLSRRDRWRVTPDHRFKSAAEMRALFSDVPEAVDNTLVIARRCAVMAETRDPILPVYPKLGDRSIEAVLRDMAEAGLERRMAQQVYTEEADEAAQAERAKPYRERLDYEQIGRASWRERGGQAVLS